MTNTTMTLEKPRERLYETNDRELVLDLPERHYLLKLRDMPAEEKPREKLMKYGPGVLASSELLAVILGVGTVKEDVLAMSRRLLKEYGETIANQKDPVKIGKLLDIPVTKACQLVACFELGRRFFKLPDAKSPVTLRTASQVFAYLKDMRELPKEHLRGLYLDAHYRLVHDELISVGTVTSNVIHPSEVFRPALEWSASAVILAHNHPSGIAKPSPADVEITNRIIAAGRLLGIAILDHVVITKTKYESVPATY